MILKWKICNKVVSWYLEDAWHMLLVEGNPLCTVSECSAVGTASLFVETNLGCYGSSCGLWLPNLSTCVLNYTFTVVGSHQNVILEMLTSLFSSFYLQTMQATSELLELCEIQCICCILVCSLYSMEIMF